MLYIEIDSFEDFLNHVGSRCNCLSHCARMALYEYWKEKAKDKDIKVSRALAYCVTERDSAMDALAYHNHFDKLEELKKGIAEGELNENEAEEKALNYLSSFWYAHCARLKNGAVLIIPF